MTKTHRRLFIQLISIDNLLLALQADLRTDTYQPGNQASFTIHDPKRRLISAVLIRNWVVHNALYNVIEPLFERQFIFDSYANRMGKGTHCTLDCCTQYLHAPLLLRLAAGCGAVLLPN